MHLTWISIYKVTSRSHIMKQENSNRRWAKKCFHFVKKRKKKTPKKRRQPARPKKKGRSPKDTTQPSPNARRRITPQENRGIVTPARGPKKPNRKSTRSGIPKKTQKAILHIAAAQSKTPPFFFLCFFGLIFFWFFETTQPLL